MNGIKMRQTLYLVSLCLNFSYAAGNSVTLSRADKIYNALAVATIKELANIHAPVIKAAELKKIIDDTNLILIDIRQPKEQDTAMLPHAITTNQFAQNFRHGIPANKTIVVYCTIGYRSGKYAETLIKQGIQAKNLEGGILAWTFVGGDLETYDTSGKKINTHTVHVYAKEWNLVHPDYKGVW